MAFIEEQMKSFDDKASVNFATRTLQIHCTDKNTPSTITKKLSTLGYPVASKDRQSAPPQNKKYFQLIASSILCILLVYLSMSEMISSSLLPSFLALSHAPTLNPSLQFLFATFIITLSLDIYKYGFQALLKRHPNMDSLIALGTSVAYCYSIFSFAQIWSGDFNYIHHLYFESSGMILVLILIGSIVEEKMRAKTSSEFNALLDLRIQEATILLGIKEVTVSVSKLQVGDIVLVKPAESISVDGEVVEGESDVDESMISGESVWVRKKVGDKVLSSSINQDSVLKIKVQKLDQDSTISQILNMLENIQASKANISKLADIFSKYFVWFAIGVAVLSFAVWFGVSGDFSFAIYIAICVLIIACPCAIGLATPVSIMVASSHATKNHILIKDALSFEKLSGLNAIALDKTGTITKGQMQITHTQFLAPNHDEILSALTACTKHSTHPLSVAIHQYAKAQVSRTLEVKGFIEHKGMGLEANVQNVKYFLGNEALLDRYNIAHEATQNQTTTVYFANEAKLLAIFSIADEIREDSKQAITELQKMGIDIYMISGDKEPVATHIAAQVGIKKEHTYSSVLPDQKAIIIKDLQTKNANIAMVGDGINDAVAFAQADISFAMATGRDIAIDSADIVLMKSSLQDITKSLHISKYTLQNIKQNLFFSVVYNSAGMAVACGLLYPFYGILLSPMVAGVAMTMSSLSVLANAMRLSSSLKTT